MQNLKQRTLAIEKKSTTNSQHVTTSTPSQSSRGKQDSKPQIAPPTHSNSTNGTSRRLSVHTPQPVEVESIQMKVGRLTIKKTRVIQNEVSTSNNKTSHLKIVRNPRFGKGSLFNQSSRPSITLQSKLTESVRPSNPNQIVKDATGKWVKVEQSVQPKRKIALSTIQSNLQPSKNEVRSHSSFIDQDIEEPYPQQQQQHEEPEYFDEEEEDDEDHQSEQQDQAFGQAPNNDYDDNQYEGQEVELENQSGSFEDEEPVKQAPEYSTKYIVALNNLSRKSTANDIRRLIETSEKNYIEDIQMEQADDYDCLIYLTNEDSQMRVIKLLHGKRVEGQILRADPAEISIEDQIESKPVQPEPRSQPQPHKSSAQTQVHSDHSQRRPQQSHREAPALPDPNTQVQQQKNIISQHLKQNTESRSSYKPEPQPHDHSRNTTKQNTQPAPSAKNAPPPAPQQQQQVQASSRTHQHEEKKTRPQTSRSNQQDTSNSRTANNSRQNVQENNRQTNNNVNNTKETNPQNHSSNRREQQQNNDNQSYQNRNNQRNNSPTYQRSLSPQNFRNQNRNSDRQRSRSPPLHVKPERRQQPEEFNRNQRQVQRSPQRDNTSRRRQSIESPPRRNQEARRNSIERTSRQPERQQLHNSSNNRSNNVTRR